MTVNTVKGCFIDTITMKQIKLTYIFSSLRIPIFPSAFCHRFPPWLDPPPPPAFSLPPWIQPTTRHLIILQPKVVESKITGIQ